MRAIPAHFTIALIALAIGCDGPADRAPAPPARPASAAPAPPAPFVIGNRTPSAIAELHVAAVAERSWEPNLLRRPLAPGADAVAARLPCAHYDLLVVRGDGARCVLPNTSLCFAAEPWAIQDVTLESCVWQR
jgi:hypothetical protein